MDKYVDKYEGCINTMVDDGWILNIKYSEIS